MNLADFHFIRPYWLLASLPAIVIIISLFRSRLNQGGWTEVCDAALLPYLLKEKAVEQNRGLLALGSMATLLVILALAGPSWQRLPTPVFRNASALVIALDLSRSMDAEDAKPSRLIRARYKIIDLLKQRKDGQTALIVYAGDAFTVTPLTDDTETIASQLPALTTDIMPSTGSNTALALQKAVDLFKQAGLQKGQIILITDGVDLDKTIEAAETLTPYRLSVLGIGDPEGAPIPLAAGGFLKDRRGALVVPKLNTADLQKLAQLGGGRYQTITADDSDIKNLLPGSDQPAAQPGKENSDLLLEQWEDRGPWLLLAAIPFVLLSFRKGVLGIILLLMLPVPKNSYALTWEDLWQTQNQQAQQAFNQQQFAKAAEQFQNPQWKAAAQYKAGQFDKALESLRNDQTETGTYNRGNALAQSGQLEEAIKSYDQALSINPNNSDAKYNKELVKKALEKQKQQQENRQQSEEKSQQNQEKNTENKQDDKKQDEQKPEQSKEKKASEQQEKTEDKSKKNLPKEQKTSSENAQQTSQKPSSNDKKNQQRPDESSDVKLNNEQRQANEQWLNRIPDDPSGLLKRKFKYQYNQREHQEQNEEDAW